MTSTMHNKSLQRCATWKLKHRYGSVPPMMLRCWDEKNHSFPLMGGGGVDGIGGVPLGSHDML